MAELTEDFKDWMRSQFQHLEELIKSTVAGNEKEHDRFRKDLDELFDHNRKLKDEMNDKCKTIDDRLIAVETRSKAASSYFGYIIAVISLGIAAVALFK